MKNIVMVAIQISSSRSSLILNINIRIVNINILFGNKRERMKSLDPRIE